MKLKNAVKIYPKIYKGCVYTDVGNKLRRTLQMKEELINRKRKLEKRLSEYGLSDYKITSALYLKYNQKDFASSSEIAKRLIVLYAIFYGATNIDKISKIKDWLININLWTEVSDVEKMFLEGEIDDEEKVEEFAWNIEKAYILAWTLNIVSDKPIPTDQISDKQFDDFVSNVPDLGTDNLNDFINNQKLRDFDEIYDENLFNELVTTYFRDQMFNGEKNKTKLDPRATFERHYTLNWVRRFSGITDWDETDTST